MRKSNGVLRLMWLWGLFLCGTACGYDFLGSTGFQLLDEPVNARLMGMGSAGTALDGGGFAYYNPAQPFFDGSSKIGFELGNQLVDLQRGFVENSWVFPTWFIGADFSSFSTGFTYIDEKDSSNTPAWYQFTNANMTTGLIRGNFALAVEGNWVQERIGTYSAQAWTMSGGMGYKVIPGKLTAGIAGFNLGWSTGFLDSSSQWHFGGLPRIARAGLGWCDTVKAVLPYTAALDIEYSYDLRSVMVPVGLEIWPLPSLAIRIGKRFNHDTELFNTGLGLRWASFQCDLAFVESKFVDDYDWKWVAGLTYVVGKKLPAAADKKL